VSGDPHELSATAQRDALRAGDLSSRELTEHYLGRIDALDGELGAFATVTRELAVEEAVRADERIAEGERSPLLGLPLGIKDLYATAGVRTTFGSAAVAEFVPAVDGCLLRRAGAVLVGKTNTAEFGATCFTHNDVTDRPTVTPYDTSRYASGSSGGAAAAVAAGLLPVAPAGDGAGSTRTPAATCHLVGVKPSRGLVSSGEMPTALTTTTIADAALLLDVMAHPAPGDLHGWRPGGSFADALVRPPARSLRVAMWTDTGLCGHDAHPEVVRAVERTAARLAELGHEVLAVTIPARLDEPVGAALRTHFAYAVNAAVAAVVPPDRRHLLLPYTRLLDAEGAALSGSDVVRSQAVLAQYAGTFLAALDGFDIALTPVTSGPPVPLGHFHRDGVAGVADAMLAWSGYTPWANFTGQPAIALPSHLDGHGLPYGVQLVGRRQRDAELLAVAAQLESTGLWHDVHPPCWAH
jgi:amidase